MHKSQNFSSECETQSYIFSGMSKGKFGCRQKFPRDFEKFVLCMVSPLAGRASIWQHNEWKCYLTDRSWFDSFFSKPLTLQKLNILLRIILICSTVQFKRFQVGCDGAMRILKDASSKHACIPQSCEVYTQVRKTMYWHSHAMAWYYIDVIVNRFEPVT